MPLLDPAIPSEATAQHLSTFWYAPFRVIHILVIHNLQRHAMVDAKDLLDIGQTSRVNRRVEAEP